MTTNVKGTIILDHKRFNFFSIGNNLKNARQWAASQRSEGKLARVVRMNMRIAGHTSKLYAVYTRAK